MASPTNFVLTKLECICKRFPELSARVVQVCNHGD